MIQLLGVFVLGGATGIVLRKPLKRAAMSALKSVIVTKRRLDALAAEAVDDMEAEHSAGGDAGASHKPKGI